MFIHKGLLFLGLIALTPSCHIGDTNYYSSPPPPPPPVFTYCPSDIVATAGPGKTTATATWETPRAVSQSDNRDLQVTLDGGLPSGSQFSDGPPTRISYRTYDNQYVVTCSFFVTVKVLYCPFLPFLKDGDRDCTYARSNIRGSVCTHTCDSGFNLRGQASLTCLEDENWDKQMPTCQPISCSRAPTVEGGFPSCPRGYQYPELCTVSCDSGYRPAASPFFFCQADGTWSTISTCRDIQPPDFPSGCPNNQQLYSGPLESPVAVTWADPYTRDNSGQPITLTSDPVRGTMCGPGLHVFRVSARDPSGNTASCNFVVNVEARKCTPLMSPVNGYFTCNSGFVEGSNCSLSCYNGYSVQGQAIVTCMQSGQWNPSLPSCVPRDCSPPIDPPYGSFMCSNGYSARSTCDLTCNRGFEVSGQTYILCRNDGTWSSTGSCLDKEAPTFPAGCPPDIEVYAARLGKLTGVTWSPPQVQDNSGPGNITLVSDVSPRSNFTLGRTKVMYSATDASGNTRTCSFTITVLSALCAVPNLDPNMVYTCPQGYVFGATCSLNCTHGYPLLGSSSITCERDDKSYPPIMFWDWNGPQSTAPKCTVISCPQLTGPKNGALACLLGNFGWDCLLNCQEGYDIAAALSNDGHIYCTSTTWSSAVVDCVLVVSPFARKYQSSLFYYADNCSASMDVIKQNFITRMNNNTVLRNACLNVATCTVENVQVICGATGRRKRDVQQPFIFHEMSETRSSLHRQTRETKPYVVTINFQINADVPSNTFNSSTLKKELEAVKTRLYEELSAASGSGVFDVESLSTVGFDDLTPISTCPQGTKNTISNPYGCVGCSKGFFMNTTNSECTECPIGSYTANDTATFCNLCPAGWSTPTTGSQSSSSCQKLCTPGYFSPNGFSPCQPCPPGKYSTKEGAMTCDLCPLNTWTRNATASSPVDCAAADYTLTNSSVSGRVIVDTWSILTVSLRVSIPDNSSLSIIVDNNSTIVSVVNIYTEGYTGSAQDLSSSTPSVNKRLPRSVKWTPIVITLAAPDQAVPELPQGVDFLNLTSAETTPTTLTLKTDSSSRVYVSEIQVTTAFPSEAQVAANRTSCVGNNSNSLFSWLTSPTGVVVPSLCQGVDNCQSSPCEAHGRCVYEVGRISCQCQDGWSGDWCQVAPPPCFRNLCQNGATCLPTADHNYTCSCAVGYTGDTCGVKIVNGGWSAWSPWEACSATCAGLTQRNRTCSSPAPQYGGSNCSGSDMETTACGASVCYVNGSWSGWSLSSPCSATCGGGVASRTRVCETAPLLHYERASCMGISSDTVVCENSTVPCPVHGEWGMWTSWSSCPVTCGGGIQSRTRTCDNPAPQYNGNMCTGSANETMTCSTAVCPSCKILKRPTGGTWSCRTVSAPYLENCSLVCLSGYETPVYNPPFLCGEETAFLWNHERSQNGVTGPLPSCSKTKTVNSASLTTTYKVDGGCDVGSEVTDGVMSNLAAQVPCVQSSVCAAQATATCDTSNRKRRSAKSRDERSAGSLVVRVIVSVDFGPSQIVNSSGNNTSGYDSLMTSVLQSLQLANNTVSLLTVTVGGQVLAPDLSSINSSFSVQCPAGTVQVNTFCVDCPAGSKAENGRCVMCPIGQYQDVAGSTSCKDCPIGLTWDTPGASNQSQCVFSTATVKTNTVPQDGENSDKHQSMVIALSVIGTILGVALILGLVYALYRWFTKNNRRVQTEKSFEELDRMSLSTPAPPAYTRYPLPHEQD